jgi:hypothetical protein
MANEHSLGDDPLRVLQERAKELSCVYRVDEILNRPDASLDEVCAGIVEAIPAGWQFPEACVARATIGERSYESADFVETPWRQWAEVRSQGNPVGSIEVFYTEERPTADEGPFLKEEAKLLGTIAERLGHYISFRETRRMFEELEAARGDLSMPKSNDWLVVVNLLRRADRDLYATICQKMLNQLLWSGVEEAESLAARTRSTTASDLHSLDGANQPLQKVVLAGESQCSNEIFELAARYFGEQQVLDHIQRWVQEDRLGFLVDISTRDLPLPEVKDALRRYRHIAQEGIELPSASRRNVRVSLIRRLLSEQLAYIRIAKDFIKLEDFDDVLQRVVSTPTGCGKLGGKAAGLLLASHIIRIIESNATDSFPVIIPETWFISSEVMAHVMKFNDLNDVIEHKYRPVEEVRRDYPRIVQSFKSCQFPPELIQAFGTILDSFEDKPIIVRSSSLLEDRVGASFAGKYKSLFLANQGTKQERLDALTDAVAEVYASVLGPDPIEYRAERGLLDFMEEMGIMIQEVIGRRVGDYFFPEFAGVAFSRNDFRWSARIKREDGLARMVPGLGTRAVDRVAADYPVLIAPGQPGLRVNVSDSEIVQYSPTHVDVINLRTNKFETVRLSRLLREHGDRMSGIRKVFSTFDGERIQQPRGLTVDFDRGELVATFNGLINDTPFVKQLHNMLRLLEDKFETPVDVEFAFNGGKFYLLQCRSQSHQEDAVPAKIPDDLVPDRILFNARRYVGNGTVGNISHIVYVDPDMYANLPDRSSLLAVGRAVGKLNTLLPKRQFILMGPGRWGSRGDIKLGVSVGYSDISNTALLVEIARKKGDYVPEVSFGTHFFQDLVEARIRYLPLYPDDESIVYNERFLRDSPNILPDMVPEYAHLADTVRLIDVSKTTNGLALQVLMNGDLDEAVALLAEPDSNLTTAPTAVYSTTDFPDDSWRWRLEMAEALAAKMEPERFGVEALYVFGSTKNATAGPGSDIDLLVHFRGTPQQQTELQQWFDGWSQCLDEINYLRTGHRSRGLLDVHFVTDEDIRKKTSYAVKIGAVTDAARELRMMRSHS